jgi:hypothetical protein
MAIDECNQARGCIHHSDHGEQKASKDLIEEFGLNCRLDNDKYT